jgi:signal transduction histidine kinase
LSLRSIPLRLKLVAALVLPMLIVAGLVAERVDESIDNRGIASRQEVEATRLAAVASFGDAIGDEAVAVNDVNTTTTELAEIRKITDTVVDGLRDPEFGLEPGVLVTLRTRYAELTSVRATIGDDPAKTNVLYQQEIFRSQSPDFDGDDPADRRGTVSNALFRLNEMPQLVTQEFEFNRDALSGIETTRLLNDYSLVQRFRADYASELSTVLRLSSTPTILIDDELIANVQASIATTDDSQRLITELGTPELAEALTAEQRTASAADYRSIRAAADATMPGEQSLTSSVEVNDAGAVVSQQYASLGVGVLDSLGAQADTSLSNATRSLVISLLISIGVLLFATLILRMLYRAIKAPIERLTAASRRIAKVELPETVAAMRRGDLEGRPETVDLVAESDDEIGDLVHAFNEMHHTAVDLAAEQAGARRVVADMFVNLGRRNQRLVNRLLKRLTLLERDETDPDKLAALYEVDHVATRMRRNAESLLVLAGASQSRKWDHPIEMYDIARGALSEVEGYERVHIDSGEDIEIRGDLVADLTHLLAELVENALSFSPPSSPVDLVVRKTPQGYAIVVADRGVGMSAEQIFESNQRIALAANQAETPSEFLGHYVIGRLAARHEILVELSDGRPVGVVAQVLLPADAVVSATGELVEELSVAGAAPALAADPARAPEPAQMFEPVVAVPAMSLGEQLPRVPAAGAPTLVDAQTIAPVQPAVAAVAVQMPPARVAVSTASVGSLVYPPLDQIDPRQREVTPRPAPAVASIAHIRDGEPAPRGQVPTGLAPPSASAVRLDLAAAQTSAADAVGEVVSTFGGSRRNPGANMPDTAVFPALSGSVKREDFNAATTDPQPVDSDEIRFQLSGFQSGTSRADRDD